MSWCEPVSQNQQKPRRRFHQRSHDLGEGIDVDNIGEADTDFARFSELRWENPLQQTAGSGGSHIRGVVSSAIARSVDVGDLDPRVRVDHGAFRIGRT